ncbi:PD-(D/E)XK nuclease family protein [Persicobacter diffluens]|uniref:PD-(D/E)XK endonuclease-like domain-containing protein n=1 Tax=Persicobacter diffluens TaxID=981 RepID=A0AAN4VVL8_9BACT|nr:hypothetical protein PEDI_04330 [Persicobacter diffluens]
MANSSTFLSELADMILRDFPQPEKLTIIFPNRRAGLFLRKAISQKINKAIWSPNVISIDDFIQRLSDLKTQDPLALNFELYHVFQEVMYGQQELSEQSRESFDQFYFWGQMLLKDFEDLDKYMVESEHLLTNVADLKAIDQQFDFLTEEEQALVEKFWTSFKDKNLKYAQGFQELWEKLPQIHRKFQDRLKAKGWGYSGMVHRHLLEKLTSGNYEHHYGNIVFAGFNALTKTEQQIISFFVEKHQARIYWDLDRYFYDDFQQEAGRFLREYKQDPILGATLPDPFRHGVPEEEQKLAADHFIQTKKDEQDPIEVIGVPLEVGQTKVAGELLQEIRNAVLAKGEKFEEEKTAVILPQEHMLFSLLHAVPEEFKSLNVTMGYPLKNTALYSFFELACQLQQSAVEGPEYPYKVVLELMAHPYLMQSLQAEELEKVQEARRQIIRRNQSMVKGAYIQSLEVPFLNVIFYKAPDVAHFSHYLTELLLYVNKTVLTEEFEEAAPEQEFVLKLYKELKKLQELLNTHQMALPMETFIRLLRQVIQGVRVPFSGEPLLGLQIMGVLETRNLDFDQVIILSMNEGAFPQAASKNSFIPYSLRKAFRLPTFEQHDAMYAYLFYRLIQRAKKVYLVHNTETDGNYKGEESRYLYQLKFESPFPLKESVLATTPKAVGANAIEIKRSPEVQKQLSRYLGENGVPLSPTALTTFLDCRLKFYFRYIAGLKEEQELQEELDVAVAGTILHNTLENLYEPYLGRDDGMVMPQQIKELILPQLEKQIEQEIRKHYQLQDAEEMALAGNNVIVKKMLLNMGRQILKRDMEYAPFTLVGLEIGRNEFLKIPLNLNGQRATVRLSGSIDRVDLKDGQLRILDYKTGGDSTTFKSVGSLFDREEKDRSKVALQTLIYSLLYDHNFPDPEEENSIVPAVYAIREMYGQQFEYFLKEGKNRLENARRLFPEIMEGLQQLLEEIFSEEQVFDQTDKEEKCRFCDYRKICRR